MHSYYLGKTVTFERTVEEMNDSAFLFYFLLPRFMATGTIKTKTDKGFGFISVEGSDDVFFHHSACDGQFDTLQIGQAVEFDIEQGPKGAKASNVRSGSSGQKRTKSDDVSGAMADETDMPMAA